MATNFDDMEPIDRTGNPVVALLLLIDSFGAKSWDLRAVAATSTCVLLGIRAIMGKWKGVEWHALLHAFVSGIGSLVCMYIDATRFGGIRFEGLSGYHLCSGTPYGLHRILPAITLGYAFVDILDGLTLALPFLFHGLATAIGMGMVIAFDFHDHAFAPLLVMEVSTIFLTCIRAEVPQTVKAFIILGFVSSFFFFRLIVIPYFTYKALEHIIHNSDRLVDLCIPPQIPYVPLFLLFAIFFTSLNAFWFSKIIQRVLKNDVMKKEKNEEQLQDGENHAD